MAALLAETGGHQRRRQPSDLGAGDLAVGTVGDDLQQQNPSGRGMVVQCDTAAVVRTEPAA
ncbi:hypothetical protein [Desertihabitans aurantiacus]|uniref:hypothetical protein n=1 Tax=Desertihabitans aurantiacus TaxID=2282477 RepID=UPI001300A062|nr:hypothetical protein [Desertihabitans aurantiacus]